MMYVIGARGRLGRAIRDSRSTGEIVPLDRSIYEDWWKVDASAAVARFFEAAPPGSVVLVVAGLLDPALPRSEHQRINVELPARIIEGACAAGLRVVTFGTVMERLREHSNAYISSKAELGRLVAERAAAGDPVMHLQLHTLYGVGEPVPFMFLGQLCNALRNGRPFEMSPGRQLREYHHVHDDVDAIHALLEIRAAGVMALSHGAPCTLRELASHVFTSVQRPNLLHIGARPEPPDDNYATVLERPPTLGHIHFRPALQGVSSYVQAVLAGLPKKE
ncbi:NAD(P)-dependent oxidoreductase [Variovorax sp. dw_308]|uniref:NAD-dependent epimerase/dehydratase family protein n=1 Tax=Variovorax sp. dw_308 TaxID=2721546 RepID=UPI001C444659|nr:NAD-dependent epimerase/dehydratase family protein [Variovorax sp. dw_308]